MLDQLHKDESIYRKLRFDIKYLNDILSNAVTGQHKILPPKYYFNGIECCQLVADALKIPITIVDKGIESTLIIPSSGKFKKVKPLVLNLESYHYDILEIQEDCIYPPLNPMYKKINLDFESITKKPNLNFEIEKYVEHINTNNNIILLD